VSNHDHVDREPKSEGRFLTSRSGLVLIVFLAIAAFFLLTEHRAHLLGILPFLLLLLCPLLHMFHGGHGGHDGHAGHDAGAPSQRESGRSGT
jgi:di/tricarboxylate transporter